MSYTYIYRKILFADWCKLIFFFFLLWNCTNIAHIDREKRNDLFKHCTIIKAHFENPRVYPIFAFDVSHFKRGEFSLILITRITTIFSLSNILQFHTILIISSVYIYIYLSWNSEYVAANDTIADESFPSSGYLRKNRNPLPSFLPYSTS